MASALGSPTVPSSQTWWQTSPKTSSRDLHKAAASSEKMHSRQSKPSSLKLLASAIGFKSKTPQSSLTIQQSPLPATLPRRAHTSHSIMTAPILSPSKSTSSTRTGADSLGPATPVDSPNRNSHHALFTPSDPDPFAVNSAASAPRTPSQSSLHSVGSDNVMPEFAPMKGAGPCPSDRLSYSSTSSNSIHHGNDYLRPTDHRSKRLVPKKSESSLHRQRSEHNERITTGPSWNSLPRSKTQTLTRTTSSTTLTENNRFSQPDSPLPPRPPMRARGLTESGISSPRLDFYPPKPIESTSRLIVRKPSVSRIGMPRCAPPSQQLPPTPPLAFSAGSFSDRTPEGSKSVNPCGIVSSPFASPIIIDQMSGKNYLSPPPSNPSSPELVTIPKANQGSLWSTPRTMKRALSHQSLRHNYPSISSTEPAPPSHISQTLHSQSSFNDFVVPTSPATLPILRHTSSFGSQPASPPKESPIVQESKRASSNTPGPGRRRLFSVSSHKSQIVDDDTRSITSVRSDSNQTIGSFSFQSLGVPLSPNKSSWEDARPQSISSISPAVVQEEYTPQHILSPAEMEKFAAGLGDVGDKSATSSRRSSAQGSSGPGEHSPSEQPTTPILRKVSTSVVQVHTARREPIPRQAASGLHRPTLKQSMSQNSLATLPRAPSPSGFASLSPPPRRRSRTRPTYPVASAEVSNDYIGFVPLPPPPRRNIRPKMSVEKALHHRSIAKKPSFLEIDDDTDEESDHIHDDPMHGSFLDLARESFDSVRTEERTY